MMHKFKKSLLFFIAALFVFSAASCSKYKTAYKDAYNLKAKGDIQAMEQSLKKFNEAIRYAIMATHGKFEALKALGIKLIQAEMYLEAAKYFEEAKLIEPTDTNIYYYLGLCYANYARIEQNPGLKKDYIDKAEITYLSGIATDPADPVLHYSLGVLVGFLKENPNEGIKHVIEALRLEPRNINALFAAGNLYYQMGKTEVAADYYRKIIEQVPSDSEHYIKAAENLKTLRLKRN